MVLIYTVIVLVATVVGYAFQQQAYLLALSMAAWGASASGIASRLTTISRRHLGLKLIAGTIHRKREIRVSISYLVGVPVEGDQLLVRGHRITTQYQPVGGVFKTHLSDPEISRRFNARPDDRFLTDLRNTGDLRLLLPGRDLPRLLRWFDSRKERELFPWREFYDELIAPGILDSSIFPYFDCAYLGTKRFRLKFDRFSQRLQLILAEVYELRPTPEQDRALRELKGQQRHRPITQIHFATREEIERGGIVSAAQTTFDIAPTALWLVRR